MDPQLPVSGSYEDLYAQASRHFELGETEEAQAMFERLVRRLGKLSEHSFARRPNLKELQVVCMRSLGVIYGRRGSFEQAMEMYRRLIDLTPPAEHADWQHAIAQLKIRQGHLQEGLDELRALAVTHGAEAWPWLSLGLVFFETGDEQEAEVNLRRATDRLTGDSDERFLTFITLFALYKNQGRYAEAEKAWQDAWGGTKKHPPKVTALYEMYLEAGELKRAESWLRKEKNPLRRGLYKGLIARAGGDANAARRQWETVAAKDPLAFESGREAWAEAALRTGHDPNHVLSVLKELVLQEEITRRGFFELAVAELLAGNLDEAHRIFGIMTTPSPNAPQPKKPEFTDPDWALLTELVPDEETHAPFEQYFELQPPVEAAS